MEYFHIFCVYCPQRTIFITFWLFNGKKGKVLHPYIGYHIYMPIQTRDIPIEYNDEPNILVGNNDQKTGKYWKRELF